MARPTLVFGHAGIGGAVTRLLRSRGWPVHTVGRTEAALKDLAQATGATYSVCDVTQDGAVEAAVRSAVERFEGRLAGLVYAVGSIPIKSARQATAEEMLQAFRLNAVGAFEAAKAAQPQLTKAEGGGAIVFFSSVAARHGFANHCLISAAKGGVEGLTVALAAEYSPNVRFNCIAPSLTQTPLAHKMTANEKVAQGIAALHPLGRLGTPDDAAALTAFLLGAESSWITGQVLALDGGRSTIKK